MSVVCVGGVLCAFVEVQECCWRFVVSVLDWTGLWVWVERWWVCELSRDGEKCMLGGVFFICSFVSGILGVVDARGADSGIVSAARRV